MISSAGTAAMAVGDLKQADLGFHSGTREKNVAKAWEK